MSFLSLIRISAIGSGQLNPGRPYLEIFTVVTSAKTFISNKDTFIGSGFGHIIWGGGGSVQWKCSVHYRGSPMPSPGTAFKESLGSRDFIGKTTHSRLKSHYYHSTSGSTWFQHIHPSPTGEASESKCVGDRFLSNTAELPKLQSSSQLLGWISCPQTT